MRATLPPLTKHKSNTCSRSWSPCCTMRELWMQSSSPHPSWYRTKSPNQQHMFWRNKKITRSRSNLSWYMYSKLCQLHDTTYWFKRSLLVRKKVKSWAAGYHYFKHSTLNRSQHPLHHSLTVEYKLLKHVVTSATEADVRSHRSPYLLRRILCKYPRYNQTGWIRCDVAKCIESV